MKYAIFIIEFINFVSVDTKPVTKRACSIAYNGDFQEAKKNLKRPTHIETTDTYR